MKYMTHNDIRNTWFRFFTERGHKIINSASLIPVDDDSILWINAGVTPLKKYFDGTKVPDCRRLVNIQKCLRMNDVDNVGITKRHQTFFEMMGNFSIGDYFKKEAIEFAFTILTSPEYYDIDKNLIYVTIYPQDEESRKRWIEVGLAEDHIIPLEGNYWEIGEGPAGPDSEIFFDRGDKYDSNHDAFEKLKNDEEQERYVEIWNNVFSQYNARKGVKREDYQELPSKNIDTGAGLERWCCIFQNVDSNFETDLFFPVIKHIEDLAGAIYNGQKEYKIIADHIRTIVFALADGAYFENVGRGYILRRLLRRSVRMGRHLGFKGAFMYKLVSDVVDTMSEPYPYLIDKRSEIEVLVMEEENLFLKTLEAGERRLKELIKDSHDGTISGEEAFKLYDTYGFPFELTQEYLAEVGYTTNKDEFDKYMEMQKDLARQNIKSTTKMASQNKVLLEYKTPSQFVYGLYRIKSQVRAIFSQDTIVDSIDHDTYIAMDRTCFYAEAGGQVSDTGMIIGKNFKARVLDVFKGPNNQNIHKVKLLDGIISINDECELIVDEDRRKHIEANHSSVHLLQYALQQVISPNIKQAGSYVDDTKLRFDFTYNGKITDEKLIEVEDLVNSIIAKEVITSTEVIPIDKARALGAMALFSEKYGKEVRVVRIDNSLELCGGTHVPNTRNIGKFAISSIETKGSNVYRIEACTNTRITETLYNAIKPYNDEIVKLLMKAKEILSSAKAQGINLDFDLEIDNNIPTSYKNIIYNKNELQYAQQEVKELEKKYFEEKKKLALNNINMYKEHAKEYANGTGIVINVNNQDIDIIKAICDDIIASKTANFIFVINITNTQNLSLVCRSNSAMSAGLIMKDASELAGGSGGGSNRFAQGGSKDTTKINEIIGLVEDYLNGKK